MSPEEWKELPGHEGVYEVSSYGRVRSLATADAPAIVPPEEDDDGVLYVQMYSNAKSMVIAYVHDLVALAFHGPKPDGMVTAPALHALCRAR